MILNIHFYDLFSFWNFQNNLNLRILCKLKESNNISEYKIRNWSQKIYIWRREDTALNLPIIEFFDFSLLNDTALPSSPEEAQLWQPFDNVEGLEATPTGPTLVDAGNGNGYKLTDVCLLLDSKRLRAYPRLTRLQRDERGISC